MSAPPPWMHDRLDNESTDTLLVFGGLTGITVPWYVVKQYLGAAEVQMSRIVAGLSESQRRGAAHDRSWSDFQRQAFVDLHSYFTCWRQVHAMLAVIQASVPSDAVKAVYRAHRPTLQRYREARDHVEHFDERLRGTRKGKPLSAPWDLGNLSNSEYTFNAERWDVSPASLNLLRTIVGEFDAALKTYALDEARRRRLPPSSIPG